MGEPSRIALVGCSKTKGGSAAPARELYRGDLFARSVAYAEATCAQWLILSAEHGLLDPDEVVGSYETTLEPRRADAWGQRVADQLVAAVPADATLVFLAGSIYGAFRGHVPNPIEEPLAGMGIGARKAWLAAQLVPLASIEDLRARLDLAIEDGPLGTALFDQAECQLLRSHLHAEASAR